MAEGYIDTDRLTPFTDEFVRKFHDKIDAFAGRAAMLGDRMPDDDDFGGGEAAKLHPDISPPGLGSVALGGRFVREPAAA